MDSRVEQGAQSLSPGQASPLAVATPMRSPVKEPGPAATAMTSTCSRVSWLLASMSRTMGSRVMTRPLAPAVIQAMHRAVDEMGTFEGFHGYGPEQGYAFLREAIAQHDYAARGVDIKPEEIFVSDGAKSDCGNIGDIFGTDNVVAVCDPVYPVYGHQRYGRTGRRISGGAGPLVPAGLYALCGGERLHP